MSVDFSIMGEMDVVKVYCKDRWTCDDESEFEGFGFERDDAGHFTWEPAGTVINFSNANARALLRFIGIDSTDLCGHIDYENIAEVRRTLVGILNREVPTLRESVNIESIEEICLQMINGPSRVVQKGQCGIYDPGLASDDVRERLQMLLDLIIEAQEKGKGICWG